MENRASGGNATIGSANIGALRDENARRRAQVAELEASVGRLQQQVTEGYDVLSQSAQARLSATELGPLIAEVKRLRETLGECERRLAECEAGKKAGRADEVLRQQIASAEKQQAQLSAELASLQARATELRHASDKTLRIAESTARLRDLEHSVEALRRQVPSATTAAHDDADERVLAKFVL